ncbi:MAG: glycosyltransferase family 4 protein [Coriobacteriia bacterium]|nr:glycosyltransferase family 4 protein [Coriobacteriia bacterium]
MRIAQIRLNEMTSDARVARSASALGQAGHEVVVFALRMPGLPDVERRDGYRVERVADFTTAGLRQPMSKFRERVTRERLLRDAVLGWSPDVVHCNDTNTLGIGANAALELGVPYVYEAHELYPDSLMQRPFQRTWPVQTYLRSVERRYIPGAAAVITVGDVLADVLAQRYGVSAEVVASTPDLMPVADRTLLRRTLGIPEDRVIVLYQGGIMIGRAVDELVEAVARVPELTLVVQGTGDYEPQMRARVRSCDVEDRVIFMGQVPHEDLFELTCGADIGTIFLDGVTLNHQLAWPNRLFMYFMAGIAVAATDLPGMAGLLEPSNAGLLARAGDVDSMASVLSRLAGDPGLRSEMGASGRRLAEDRFNWEHERRKLLAIYETIEKRDA